MKFLRVLFSRQWILTTFLVLAGVALCVRLGFWQVSRLAERRAFNAHVESVWAMESLDLTSPQPEEYLFQQEYRSATLSGTYDFDNQVALRNRYFENKYGYHLLTPLILDNGSAILVDRGWIPAEGNDRPEDWRKYDEPGRVTLQGQIRLGSTEPDLGGVPDPELAPGQEKLEFWNLVNLERIRLQLPYPLLVVFIQPDIDPEDHTPPIPYQPTLELTEGSHKGYAMQWFTYASLLFFGYPFYVRQQMKETS